MLHISELSGEDGREKVYTVIGKFKCEMTNVESQFLLALIRRYKPSKILEIGVAEGGTTCLIFNELHELGLKDTKVYSVDYSKQYYLDNAKKSGYLAYEYRDKIAPEIDWYMYSGGYSIDFLEKIGGEIDFVILDTVHKLPGEMLDMLAVYPFLSKNAVVVLHDTMLHVNMRFNRCNSNNFLFHMISGEKIVCDVLDGERELGFASISAIELNDSTQKNIDNMFSGMSFTWEYLPSVTELEKYMNWYRKYYTSAHTSLFGKVILIQEHIALKHEQWSAMEFEGFMSFIHNNPEVYLFGLGHWAEHVCYYLEHLSLLGHISGIIVSDDHMPEVNSYKNIPIYDISNTPDCIKTKPVLLTTNRNIAWSITSKLYENGFTYVI